MVNEIRFCFSIYQLNWKSLVQHQKGREKRMKKRLRQIKNKSCYWKILKLNKWKIRKIDGWNNIYIIYICFTTMLYKTQEASKVEACSNRGWNQFYIGPVRGKNLHLQTVVIIFVIFIPTFRPFCPLTLVTILSILVTFLEFRTETPF